MKLVKKDCHQNIPSNYLIIINNQILKGAERNFYGQILKYSPTIWMENSE